MTKVEQALKSLKEEIFENPLVKEYFRVREVVAKDETLNQLKKRISDAQVNLSLSMAEQEKHQTNKVIYEQLLNDYDTHPLIVNFTQLQAEVHTLLKEIVDLLE